MGQDGNEKELQLDYDTLKKILDDSYDEIYVTDPNGLVLYVNKASEKHYGIKPEEMIGKTSLELSEKKYWTPRVNPIVFHKNRSITLEQKTSVGKTLLTTVTPLCDENGKVIMIIENSRDITESEGIRNELEMSKKLLNKYKSEVEELKKKALEKPEFIYKSKKMANSIDLALRIAKINSTVLLLGESGTGKSLLAEYIHKHSSQKDGPLITTNCAAIPSDLMEAELFGFSGLCPDAGGKGRSGLIELADGGTLFLDEITEIPLRLQAKLLHALQEKVYFRVGGRKECQVNCRIIAATNQDLQAMVAKEEFRDDLYYRINVFEIRLPALRDRPEDIIPLVHDALRRFNARYGLERRLSQGVLDMLVKYSWPGNVREMENTIERLVVMAPDDLIDVPQLPEAIRSPLASEILPLLHKGSLDEALSEVERKIILHAYDQYGSSYEVAKALQMSQSKASRLIRKYCGGSQKSKSKKTDAQDEHLS